MWLELDLGTQVLQLGLQKASQRGRLIECLTATLMEPMKEPVKDRLMGCLKEVKLDFEMGQGKADLLD